MIQEFGMDIEVKRKRLMGQQTELRKRITDPAQFEAGMVLFFEQHASLHSASVSNVEGWSYEDALLDDLSEAQFRRIPRNCEHSIVWCIWHLARIEDTAMNILVADSTQVFNQGSWGSRLGVPYIDTGNAIRDDELKKLSQEINLQALRDYRAAVGRRTREIVAQLEPPNLKHKVDSMRIQRVLDEGAVIEAARGVTDYWGKRDIAGLLLMPGSRHNLVHLNEVLKIKKRKT
jgi:hypothetical protein